MHWSTYCRLLTDAGVQLVCAVWMWKWVGVKAGAEWEGSQFSDPHLDAQGAMHLLDVAATLSQEVTHKHVKPVRVDGSICRHCDGFHSRRV